TIRYYIDGHQVSSLIAASGGDSTIQWTVVGSGRMGGREFTIDGAWTLQNHGWETWPGPVGPAGKFSQCALSGEEHYRVGTLHEAIVMPRLMLDQSFLNTDLVGTVQNVLSAPDAGIWQTYD